MLCNLLTKYCATRIPKLHRHVNGADVPIPCSRHCLTVDNTDSDRSMENSAKKSNCLRSPELFTHTKKFKKDSIT